jgi:GDP-D-mannose dehydratase
MRKCALITGITEQAGSYPADLLLAKGYDVPGLKCQSLLLQNRSDYSPLLLFLHRRPAARSTLL